MAYIYLIYSIRDRPVSRQGRRGELLLEIENRADGARRGGHGGRRCVSRQIEALEMTISDIAGARDIDFSGFDSTTPLRQLDSVIHEPIEPVVRRIQRPAQVILDCFRRCAYRISFPVVFDLVDGIGDGACDIAVLGEMKDGSDGQSEFRECGSRRFLRGLPPERLEVLLAAVPVGEREDGGELPKAEALGLPTFR